jgi:hypothetical protein
MLRVSGGFVKGMEKASRRHGEGMERASRRHGEGIEKAWWRL